MVRFLEHHSDCIPCHWSCYRCDFGYLPTVDIQLPVEPELQQWQHQVFYSLYYSPNALLAAIYFSIMCIADGAIIRAVNEMYVGHSPTVFSTLQWGFFKLGPLFCISILVGTVVGMPMVVVLTLFFIVEVSGMRTTLFCFTVALALACAYFSTWIVVVTYHIYPSIVIENQGILRSISRSLELSSGQRMYIFTRLTVFLLVKGVFKQIFLSIATDGSEGAKLFSSTLVLMLNVLFGSFSSMYVPYRRWFKYNYPLP